MCGRFCIAASPGELMDRYEVTIPGNYLPRYNLAPSQLILAITEGAQAFEAHMYEWGITTGISHRIINARVETVHEKPLFKNLFEKHRCLIPASGYYEWKHDGNRKTPYYFSSQSDPIISFAGLIRPSSHGDQIVILTTKAIPPYADIHDRMPVIFNPMSDREYLTDGAISLIGKPLELYEVSSRVNQVGVDDPDLIKPWKAKSGQMTLRGV